MKKIKQIKERYLKEVIAYPDGIITHSGCCSIYRAPGHGRRVFCGCGLLHDVNYLWDTIARKLYPKYHEEQCLQEESPPYEPMPEEQFNKLLEEWGFGKIYIPIDDDHEWELIEEICGELATKNLKKRYQLFLDQGHYPRSYEKQQ